MAYESTIMLSALRMISEPSRVVKNDVDIRLLFANSAPHILHLEKEHSL